MATIHKAGGWPAVMATSPDWHMLLPADDPDFPWTMYLGGMLCISVFYCAANQFIVQRTLAAKNEWHARMGVVFADYLKFLMPLVIIVPGLLAPQLYPDLETARPGVPHAGAEPAAAGAGGPGDGRPDRRGDVARLRRGQLLHHHRHDRLLPAVHQPPGHGGPGRPLRPARRRGDRAAGHPLGRAC